MNEQLSRWLQSARAKLEKLSPRQRTVMTLTALAVVGGVAATSLFVTRDPQQVLYTDLRAEEAKAVAKKLSEMNLVYTVSEDHSTITVASSQVHSARMQLAKDGLPGQDVVGFEKFDGSTFGMSSYVQRIQYIRAIQGELTRSIQHLAAVKTARVHISIPPKKTFLEEEEPPKASIVLELKRGQTPSKAEIQGVAHLVASAVEGLKVSQVVIVDTLGNFLHRPEDGAGQNIPTTLLEMQRGIETEYERRIEDILTPVVGVGKVRAKVTAEIDPSRMSTTEETFDPDKTAVRTNVRNEEIVSGSRPTPGGIPGSRSNLPGTEGSPIAPSPLATNSTEKNTQNTNYAIPRKVQVTDKPSGNIKRLTVAVLVDGHWEKSSVKGAPETFTPRADEELNRIKELVGNAVGYDAQRRDSINVSSMPFHQGDVLPLVADDAPAASANGRWYDKQQLIFLGWRAGLVAIVCMLVYGLILRPLLRRSAVADVPPETSPFPRTVAELQAAAANEEALLPAGKEVATIAAILEDAEPADKREETELKKKILERLLAAPGKGFSVVQDWLEEEEPTPVEG